ncbi:MAG TPA: hypothetical protein PK402_00670 [Tepidisphaeraceae bacterium]|nr:hypothetical protein [Tepidisphaeraceae bacterium]
MAIPDTHQKALEINLDPTSFGSFAEIGAGQEVARWFLRVGAASATVAKTVSAYDKVVSDDLYGAGTRYVSKPRLEAMLECEWKALIHQVGEQRSQTTRFFAFANTIAARNFAGTNDCHGWIGMRFQNRPRAEPSDILLHVNLRDSANLLQQEAIGVLGVNLLHAMLAKSDRAVTNELPARLFENLSVDRIEIDQIEMRGSAFEGCDLRSLHVALARDAQAEAVTVSSDGAAVAANEFLYKKSVVLAPVASDPRDDLSPQAVAACVEALRREIAGNAEVKDVIGMRLLTVTPEAPRDSTGLGDCATMVTRHQPLYRASAFVRRYTQAPLRFATTLPALMRIFDEVRYQQLDGRMLEGISRLFGNDVRVLAYPSQREVVQRLLSTDTGRGWTVDGNQPWITAEQVRPAPPLRHLYDYLIASKFLVALPPQ